MFRLGKKQQASEDPQAAEPKPRLILVKLKNKDHVEMLMKRRLNLKERGYPNVYITKDLPPEEREVQKKLRKELAEKGKETHRIFQGKVIRRE